MKLPTLLVAASLAANAALVGLLYARPTLAPPAVRSFFVRGPAADGTTARRVPVRTAEAPRKLWASLGGDDLPTLIQRLRAAGFPPSIVREIVRAEISARYDARIRAIIEPDPNVPYWKQSTGISANDSKRMEQYTTLQRERNKLLREVLADDFFASEEASAAQRRQFGNLPRQKIDLLQRLEDDYGEMLSAVRAGTNGILLPEDREKIALLTREKKADLAAMLTPEELADYEMRSSPITNMMRNRLGNFQPTEAEFRAIFQMQQALNDKFPYNSGIPTDYTQRQEATRTLNAQLKATLGDARYAEMDRETTSEYQALSRLAQRDGIPNDVAVRAFNVRDHVAQESNRIFDDTTLSPDDKRAALATLAQATRAQLVTLLGPTTGNAYVKQIDNQWLGQVERGSAVAFSGTGSLMSISSVNGVSAMVSLGSSPTYRRVPPVRPPPRQ
jgi:hypothetical protein